MVRSRGQNLIEFLLIVALVAIGGIFALTSLGGNVHNLLSGSAAKQAGFDPFNVKNQSVESASGGSSVTVVSSQVIDGYSVDINSDGSVSFAVKGQTVNLPAEDLQLLDTVFETSGSEGIELIKAIAKLIEENKVDGGPDIPIE
ncbi:MAG: Flp family type IVb pilin, partial [Vampirovibrionia bacterium]